MTNHDAHAGGHGDHPGPGGDDTTGVHGMLLFGEDVVYLSHLPMFMSPHNFQVLLEVGFDDAVHEVLRADRDASGGGLHTFEPEVFAITELDPAVTARPAPPSRAPSSAGTSSAGGPRSPSTSPPTSAPSSTSPSSTSRRATRPTRR